MFSRNIGATCKIPLPLRHRHLIRSGRKHSLNNRGVTLSGEFCERENTRPRGKNRHNRECGGLRGRTDIRYSLRPVVGACETPAAYPRALRAKKTRERLRLQALTPTSLSRPISVSLSRGLKSGKIRGMIFLREIASLTYKPPTLCND